MRDLTTYFNRTRVIISLALVRQQVAMQSINKNSATYSPKRHNTLEIELALANNSNNLYEGEC